jgi:hypothetical protein
VADVDGIEGAAEDADAQDRGIVGETLRDRGISQRNGQRRLESAFSQATIIKA